MQNMSFKKFAFFFLLGLATYFLVESCESNSYSQNVPKIPSVLDTLYDDYNGKQVLKVRKIFRKGISYRYNAKYFTAEGAIISDNFVEIIPSGERWEMQPERQDVMELRFGYTQEEQNWVLANPINKTLDLSSRWTSDTWEGLIENENEVWIHPIRHNQYVFTEVAPFPEVKFPIEKDKTWRAGLGSLGGWGDWDGMDIISTYKVIGQETIKTMLGKIACWRIEAKAEFDLGTSTLVYHFHEDLGFVRMDYVNYVGQQLIFELEEIKEI